MKQIFIAAMLFTGGWAHAGLTQTFGGGTVLQGNPTGTAFTGNFTPALAGAPVQGITVNLNVTGGYSGGFYIYLVAPNGSTTVTLMDTPGTSTSGMNVTFSDTGTTMTSGSDLSSGTYQPYNTDSTQLPDFNGQTADGSWTLYFADLSSGGGNPTLNSWTLNIDAVPEPVNVALALFGLCVVGGNIASHLLRRKNLSPAD